MVPTITQNKLVKPNTLFVVNSTLYTPLGTISPSNFNVLC